WDDRVLAIFKNGTFYTTTFDLSSRYQGDVLKIEKFDPGKTYTALYYDAKAKSFYVKRFSFVISDNSPQSFIAEGQKSYLVDISEDKYPQFQVIFGGKNKDRAPENVDAEQWIGKKGVSAKGKKVSDKADVKGVRFIEALIKEEKEEESGYDDAVDIIDTDFPEPSAEIPEVDVQTDIINFEEPTLF
ncbi:MAG: hypothetical protein MJY42_04115, partial [Bacteroidales bacterium]|nr:hypothetical protein [Bacteroidales bacterium]